METAHVRQEHVRGRLDGELLAHEPQTLGGPHCLDHVLRNVSPIQGDTSV